jgi:hypothetical protein
MDVRQMASRHALGRVGFGVAMLLAPGATARAWVGPAGGTPGARVLTTALGARDVAIGLGQLHALRGAGGRPAAWLRASALADAADCFATIRARDEIPLAAVIGVGALAGGSVAFGLFAERALAHSAP